MGRAPVTAQHEAVGSQYKWAVLTSPSRGLCLIAPGNWREMSPPGAPSRKAISLPTSLGATAINPGWWRRQRGLFGPRLTKISVGFVPGRPASGPTINMGLKYPAQDLQALLARQLGQHLQRRPMYLDLVALAYLPQFLQGISQGG